jgi:hypothetical protein
LKTADKLAAIFAVLIARSILLLLILVSVFTFSVASAVYLGDATGSLAYRFLLVASFYALMGIVSYFVLPFNKMRLYRTFIS